MNFLAEVIASAEQVQMETISESVPNIKLKIDKHEKKVTKFVDDYYKNYKVSKISNLIKESEVLTSDMHKLKKQVNDANASSKNCNEKMKELTNTVVEAATTLEFTHTLIEGHTQLQEIKKEFANGRFKQALEILKTLKEGLSKLPDDSMADLVLPHVLNTEDLILKKLLLICMENIKMTEISNQIATLAINSDKRYQCLNSMYVLECNESLSCLIFYKLTLFVLEKLLKPIFYKNVNIEFHKSNKDIALTVITQDATEKPTCDGVLTSLKTIFAHLHEMLLMEDKTCPLLPLIGKQIANKFQRIVIDDCLTDTIPFTEEGLENFDIITKQVEEFQAYVIEIGFFESGSSDLVDYVSNVDYLFLNKKYQVVLERALALMKKDLHDTIEITEDEKEAEGMVTSFPRCHISRSCVELLELVKSLLTEYAEDKKHGPESENIIYSTIDTIFNRYPTTVKSHHAKLLESIPQQSALFYNNCQYLAHTITFDPNFKVPNKLDLEVHVHRLTSIGSEMFEKFVDEQQDQIESIVENSGLSDLQTSDTLNVNVEKSIRQCLRQQELLKTVWQKILPYEVYNRTLGQLLSAFCNGLIDKVTKVHDISSTSAEQLVDIFNVVVTRGSKLLSDPKEINMYVVHWNKFKQLILILSSSLLEISDQWADGKGPLALYFTADEVKQLIKAIFQNTERRKNILANIM